MPRGRSVRWVALSSSCFKNGLVRIEAVRRSFQTVMQTPRLGTALQVTGLIKCDFLFWVPHASTCDTCVPRLRPQLPAVHMDPDTCTRLSMFYVLPVILDGAWK